MEVISKNSHTVYIRRLPQFASAAQKDLEEYFANSQRGYGSYFSKGSVRTATGLSPTEEDLLMPYILSIPKEDRDFRKGVTTWFEGISVKVGAGDGLALEVGLEVDNKEPVDKDNLPLSITDYVKYRHALGHPWIASSEDTGRGNQLMQYYIFDPSEVSKVTVNQNEERDEALGYYLTIKTNSRSVGMYLTLLGVRTNTLRKGEEAVELRKIVDKKPKAFIALYNDKDKEIKYIIEEMINYGILERVNTRVLLKETGEQIGRDIKEAVLYLKDSRNTKMYATLQARLQEKWKNNSISVDTDADLQITDREPEPATIAEIEEPATELIPAAAPETQVPVEGSAGDIDD